MQTLFERGELQFHGQLDSLAPPAKFGRLVRKACRLKWVVYAKRPFAGPEAVLAYLSRYTHRVGITNKRILALDEESRTVSFAYKDYADESRRKVMTLASGEFVRRFCLHILPPRFVKIRHYGFLSNRNRNSRVAEARAALGPDPKATVEHTEIESAAVAPATAHTLLCPYCGKPGLVLVRVIRPPRFRSAGYDDTS